MNPFVDVVIPVHRAERPVERAVASVLGPGSGAPGAARAIVVCHNISASVFADRLAPFGRGVLTVELADGMASPAGPLNAGLEAARAPWVTCMGSDDFQAPGAVAAWVAHLRRRNPDVLILPVADQRTGQVDIPPVRPWRRLSLDPVADRLTYRTGPLMLVRRTLVRSHHIRMDEGLRTGEDLAYSAHVLLAAGRIDLLAGPPYIEADDGAERVTRQPFAVAELLVPAQRLAGQAWVGDLDPRRRHALAVRVIRKSVLPALLTQGADLTDADRARAAASVNAWLTLDPDLLRPLSVAEARAVASLAGEGAVAGLRTGRIRAAGGADAVSLKAVQDALAGLTRGPRYQKVLPPTLSGLAEPDTRLRHLGVALLNAAGRRLARGQRGGAQAGRGSARRMGGEEWRRRAPVAWPAVTDQASQPGEVKETA